ncbi:MAG: T9SS type A sorting domain-containing protein, partial [Bacteroidia bacterium]
WTSLAATAANTPQSFTSFWDLIWNVATNPADTVNDDVYAATLGAVYKSTNGGTSWTTSLGGSTSAYSYFTDVKVTTKGVVYATLSSDGPQKGIWRSPNGITFTNILPVSGFPTSYNRMVIGVNPQNENEIYILGNTPGFGTPDTNYLGDLEWNSLWKYTYVSGTGDSAGGIWTNLSANLPNNGGLFDKYNCQGSYDIVVKVKPNDSNVVYIGGTNLYRSTSAFADTTHTTFIGGYKHGATLPVVNMFANHHPDQHVIFFSPTNPDVMYSGNDGGVFKTTNDTAATVAWSSLNNGYTNTMFYTVAVDHASPGNNIVIGGAQDNGSWYTNTANVTTPWVTPRGGDGSFCAIADNQTAYYFSIQNGKIMRATLDANGNVTNFARIDPIGGKNYLFVNPFILDPNNNNIMYLAGGKNLWRNNNLSGIPYASNWDSISTNWTEFPDTVPLAGSFITAVTVSTTPANRVYYGTDHGKLYRIDNANTGTPTEINISGTTYPNAFPANAYINCIAVDPLNANNLMVVFSNYSVYSIYYSSNGGTTWAKAAGNLEQNSSGSGNGPSCRWASIMHVSDGTVYLVATSTGLYATDTLKGTSTVFVQQVSNLIGNAVCDMIDVRPSDGLVVVATHSHGIYSTHITSVGNVADVPVTAEKDAFNLSNYPNPFSISTHITFQLNSNAMVTISVFDALGRKMTTLQNGELSAGKQEFTLQKNNFSDGLYYCVLTVNGVEQVRKMIVTH